MRERTDFCLNKASEAEIADHLLRCDTDFVPPLSDRVELSSYAHKIACKAVRFEAWGEAVLVGLVATYCNDSERRVAYITNVSVMPEWKGAGIASCLLDRCIEHVKKLGFEHIELEVDSGNAGAVRLYEKKGFTTKEMSGREVIMRLNTGKDA